MQTESPKAEPPKRKRRWFKSLKTGTIKSGDALNGAAA